MGLRWGWGGGETRILFWGLCRFDRSGQMDRRLADKQTYQLTRLPDMLPFVGDDTEIIGHIKTKTKVEGAWIW